jgi:CheY-like chemotaxis protein
VSVLTADVTADTRQACERAGMNDFLTKPITAEALAAAFARVTVVRSAVA